MDTLFKFHLGGYCMEFSPKDHHFPYRILICELGCTGGEVCIKKYSGLVKKLIRNENYAKLFSS